MSRRSCAQTCATTDEAQTAGIAQLPLRALVRWCCGSRRFGHKERRDTAYQHNMVYSQWERRFKHGVKNTTVRAHHAVPPPPVRAPPNPPPVPPARESPPPLPPPPPPPYPAKDSLSIGCDRGDAR